MSLGAPWVAQRVWAMPVVPANRLGSLASRSRTRPLALAVFSPALWAPLAGLPWIAMPAES